MTELTAEKIKKAGSIKMILVWRKVYNSLCRDCQHKIFRAGTDVKQIGTNVVADRMKEIIDNHLCIRCQMRVKHIMAEAQK